MMKRLAITVLVLLMIPSAYAQDIDNDPTPPPEVVEELVVPPRSGAAVDYDDVADITGEDEDVFPPQWAVEDTFALVSVNRANLRSQPSITEGVVVDIAIWGERFPIVGIYFPGESTVREPESDDFVFDDPGEREVWYLVDVNGGAAWIFGGVVIVANPETLDAFENRTLTAEQQAYIDSQIAFAQSTISVRFNSRLRSGPGTSYSQVGIVPFQSRVSIIGRNEYSTWFYVDYNGRQGWLSYSVLAIPSGFDATAVPIVQ